MVLCDHVASGPRLIRSRSADGVEVSVSPETSTASRGRHVRFAIGTLRGHRMADVVGVAFRLLGTADSYFRYSLCSRVPVFAAAMLGAVLLPAGAFLVWRRFDSVLWGRHRTGWRLVREPSCRWR